MRFGTPTITEGHRRHDSTRKNGQNGTKLKVFFRHGHNEQLRRKKPPPPGSPKNISSRSTTGPYSVDTHHPRYPSQSRSPIPVPSPKECGTAPRRRWSLCRTTLAMHYSEPSSNILYRKRSIKRRYLVFPNMLYLKCSTKHQYLLFAKLK